MILQAPDFCTLSLWERGHLKLVTFTAIFFEEEDIRHVADRSKYSGII
jgi:hypothetical protein